MNARRCVSRNPTEPRAVRTYQHEAVRFELLRRLRSDLSVHGECSPEGLDHHIAMVERLFGRDAVTDELIAEATRVVRQHDTTRGAA